MLGLYSAYQMCKATWPCRIIHAPLNDSPTILKRSYVLEWLGSHTFTFWNALNFQTARYHWKAARHESSWLIKGCHSALACMESIPLLGQLIALIETVSVKFLILPIFSRYQQTLTRFISTFLDHNIAQKLPFQFLRGELSPHTCDRELPYFQGKISLEKIHTILASTAQEFLSDKLFYLASKGIGRELEESWLLKAAQEKHFKKNLHNYASLFQRHGYREINENTHHFLSESATSVEEDYARLVHKTQSLKMGEKITQFAIYEGTAVAFILEKTQSSFNLTVAHSGFDGKTVQTHTPAKLFSFKGEKHSLNRGFWQQLSEARQLSKVYSLLAASGCIDITPDADDETFTHLWKSYRASQIQGKGSFTILLLNVIRFHFFHSKSWVFTYYDIKTYWYRFKYHFFAHLQKETKDRSGADWQKIAKGFHELADRVRGFWNITAKNKKKEAYAGKTLVGNYSVNIGVYAEQWHSGLQEKMNAWVNGDSSALESVWLHYNSSRTFEKVQLNWFIALLKRKFSEVSQEKRDILIPRARSFMYNLYLNQKLASAPISRWGYIRAIPRIWLEYKALERSLGIF